MPVSPEAVAALVRAQHGDPFSILGRHGGEVRVLRPDARECTVLLGGREFPAVRENADGFFVATVSGEGRHHLRFTAHNGHVWESDDAFSFPSPVTDLDQHLFSEGNHWELWKFLGAHTVELDGTRGTMFRVWAPGAGRVSIVGDWNGWDGRTHPMRKLFPCGVWEIFIPGVAAGAHYKIELLGADGALHLKSDPLAFHGQHGEQTASLVRATQGFEWADDEWMARRAATNWLRAPVSIYEVHPGSWRRGENDRWQTWRELSSELLDYVCENGFTHIELMAIAEHPFDGSWGYQVCGYFAPTSRFGSPDDFRHFVNEAHRRGIGIILDWVPGHFPKDAHGLARFDGSALYEHLDPRQGEHQDWGTLIFNYGRNEVRNFLIANALFWLAEYHIDGLRVDAVASMLYLDYSRKAGEWIPNAHGGRENIDAIHFLKRTNEVCHERHPGVLMIAEESTAWPGVSRPTFLGGLGFGLKWNMGWMHDTLGYMALDPVFRRYHHGQATFSLVYAFHENFVLVLSHDEVVHGKRALLEKMPGDDWQKFANLRLLYAWMWAHPGKKLLFMGGEFAQRREWSHERSLDWHLLENDRHRGMQALVRQLNFLHSAEPAFHDQDDVWEGYEWLDIHDADNSVLAFLRISREGRVVAVVVNATPCVRGGYRIGVPHGGLWREVLNTDAAQFGGGNVGNFGGVEASDEPWSNRPFSLKITLPPLAVVVFAASR